MEGQWDQTRGVWYGHAAAPAGPVDIAITPGEAEPEVARSYAAFALTVLLPRVDEARRYAARRLAEYYIDYQLRLPAGDRVTAEEFADRLRLEGVRFRGDGSARLDFGHDLYPGDALFSGGLIVVEATVEGRFRRAYWVTGPDAAELREARRPT